MDAITATVHLRGVKMKATRIEKTIIPVTTKEGELFAAEYESRLKKQHVLRKKIMRSETITLIAEYHFSINDDSIKANWGEKKKNERKPLPPRVTEPSHRNG